MTNTTLNRKPNARNKCVRFGEGGVASAKPRRWSLLSILASVALTVGASDVLDNDLVSAIPLSPTAKLQIVSGRSFDDDDNIDWYKVTLQKGLVYHFEVVECCREDGSVPYVDMTLYRDGGSKEFVEGQNSSDSDRRLSKLVYRSEYEGECWLKVRCGSPWGSISYGLAYEELPPYRDGDGRSWSYSHLTGGGVSLGCVGTLSDSRSIQTCVSPGADPSGLVPGEIAGEPVREIADYAFSGERLDAIILPATVERVCMDAFEDCHATNIVFSPALKNIGYEAFAGNRYSEMSMPFTIPEGVTNIGDLAFSPVWTPYADPGGTAVRLPGSLRRILGAFANWHQLTDVTLPDGVEYISGTFQNTSIRNLTVPSSVIYLANITFHGLEDFESLTFKGRPPEDGGTVYWAGSNDVAVYYPVEYEDEWQAEIGYYAESEWFDDFDGSLFVPYGEIKYEWSYRIEGGGAVLGNGTDVCVTPTPFWDVEVPATLGGYPVTCIASNAFFGCSRITSLTLPDTVTNIQAGALAEMSGLMNLTLPCALQAFLPDEVLVDTPARETFVVPEESACLRLRDGFLFTVDGELLWCRSVPERLVFPEGVRVIGDYQLFANHLGHTVREVVLPSTMERIGAWAFAGLGTLTNVTFNAGLKEIGPCAFSSCTGLRSVVLDHTSAKIGYRAFEYARSLSSLTLPPVLPSLDSGTFAGCSNLTLVDIPVTVTNIGYSAFQHCSSLRSLELPDALRAIGEDAFNDCSSLTNIVFGSSLEAIGQRAFANCTGLSGLVLPDAAGNIGRAAFFGCSSLDSVVLPEGLTNVEGVIFGDCPSLREVAIQGSPPENWWNLIYDLDFDQTPCRRVSVCDDITFIVPEDLLDAWSEVLNAAQEIGATARFRVVDASGRPVFAEDAVVHVGEPAAGAVWRSNAVHVVVGDCRVSTLTIESGAVVKFVDGACLKVSGDCVAEGVTFVPAEDDSVGGKTLLVAWEDDPFDPDADYPGGVEGDIIGDEKTVFRNLVEEPVFELAGDTVWSSDAVHVISCLLTARGVKLTIERGAVVKFRDGTSLSVEYSNADCRPGSCVAEGVVFTHVADDTVGGDTDGDGDRTTPSFGAYQLKGRIQDDEDTEYRYQVLSDGNVLDNWLVRRGVYLVDSVMTISRDNRLWLQAGTTFKFTGAGRLVVEGTLVANGTRLSPVVFTSSQEDPQIGDWGGILVSGGQVTANYTQFLYGGGEADNPTAAQACLFMWSGARGNFSGCRFAGSPMDGCFAQNATFENCLFDDCDRGLVSSGGDDVRAVNCLAINNRIGYFSHVSPLAVLNSISAFNAEAGFDFDSSSLTADHCCVYNPDGDFGRVTSEIDCIRADPCFVDSVAEDYTLSSDSPCIDAALGWCAPEKDYFGHVRYDGLGVTPMGTPAANGKYPDIGISEYLSPRIVSSIDLRAVSVSVDEPQACIGSEVTVRWTVENIGEATADGERRDVVELIDAAGAVWTLGEVIVSARLGAGESSTDERRYEIPAVAEGTARVRLRVNVYRDVFEGAQLENNVVDSLQTLMVGVSEWPTGVHAVELETSLSGRLSVTSDVTAIIVRGGADVTVIGGVGFVPVGVKCDVGGVRLADGSLLLSVPPERTGDFVFTLINHGQEPASVAVETVSDAYRVFGVEPTILATTSSAEFRVCGVGLASSASVRLVGTGGTAVGQVLERGAGELGVEFDGTGLAAGSYDLELSDREGTVVRLPSAVTVYRPTVGPKPSYRLDIPSAVREGRIYTGRIVYGNEGDAAMLAPCFLLTAVDAEVRFRADDEWTGGGFEVVGIAASDPAGLIGPKSSHELEFEFRAGRNSKLSLLVDDDGSSGWCERKQRLSDAATIVNRRGRRVFEVGELEGYAELFASGGDAAAVCGTLVDMADGSPMSGTEVVARLPSGEAVSSDTVDEAGVFVLENIPSGTNVLLSVVSGGFGEDLAVAVPETGDVRGIQWLAERGYSLEIVAAGAEEADFASGIEVIVASLEDVLSSQSLVLTNAAGVCITVRQPGDYLISGRMRGGWETSAIVSCRPRWGVQSVRLDFAAGCAISGHVVDETGRPVTNATISLRRKGQLTDLPSTVRGGADGSFSFGCIADGGYVLTASAAGYGLVAERTVNVSDADVEGCDIGMVSYGNAICGTVVGATEGLRVAFDMEQVGISSTSSVAADGTFELSGLPTGIGTFSLTDQAGHVRCVLGPLVVRTGVNVLRVSEAADECCVMGCARTETGEILTASWTFVPTDGNALSAVSADGADPVLSLRKALYDITVVAPGFVARTFRRVVTGACRLTVPLERGGRMRIVDPDPESALVKYAAGGRLYDGAEVADGLLTGVLAPGTEVRAFVAGTNEAYLTETGVVQAGVTGVLARAAASRPLSIRIVGEAAKVAYVRVVLSGDEGFSALFPVFDGIVSLSAFPECPASIEALAADGSVLGVQSLPAMERSVSVTVGPSAAVSGRVVGSQNVSLGGCVVFVSADGRRLSCAALTAGGAFWCDGVSDEWTVLWVELSDGTVCKFSRTAVEACDFVLNVPTPGECGLVRTKVVDAAGNPVPGARIVFQTHGYSYVRFADATGTVETKVTGDAPLQSDPLPPAKASDSSLPADLPMHESDVQPLPCCSNCGGFPCRCPHDKPADDGGTPDMTDMCPSCGRSPCCCPVPEEAELDSEADPPGPVTEEPADQLELEPLLVPPMSFAGLPSDWDPWWAWYSIYSERIGRTKLLADRLFMSPDPKYAMCERKNCTVNARIYRRFMLYKGRAVTACDLANVRLEEVDHDSYAAVSAILQDIIIASASLLPGSGALDAARSYQESGSAGGFARNGVDSTLTELFDRYLTGAALQTYWDGCSHRYGRNGKTERQLLQLYEKACREASVLKGAVGAVTAGGTTWSALKRVFERFARMNTEVLQLRDMTVTAELRTYLADRASKVPYHCCSDSDPVRRKISEQDPETPQSIDPNEVVGPEGTGPLRLLKPGATVSYTVYFENAATASASAADIWVTSDLSPALDWTTFEMGDVAFANQLETGLRGLRSGTAETAQKDTSYFVRSRVSLDSKSGRLGFELHIVDKTTKYGVPDDPYAGVLSPNDASHRGEGYFSYRIRVRDDIQSGIVISNAASIVFDQNGAIVTRPAWWNTVGIPGVAFAADALEEDEGGSVTLTVNGGNADKAASVQVYLTYQTAAATDLDLAKGQLDGVTPKGGLKFPLTLSWAVGDTEPKTITIPVKTDKAVEDDETLVFQLAAAQGMELGVTTMCKVTIRDANVAADYAAKQAKETVKTKKGVETEALAVACCAADGSGDVCGYTTGQGKYSKGSKASLKATARPGWAFKGWGEVVRGGALGDRPLPDGVAVTNMVSDKASWSVTLTNDAEIVAVFGRIPYVAGLASPADGGKVSGSGYCATGKKKITLKATANKGYVFRGWYEGASVDLINDVPLTKSATYTLAEMPTNDVEYTAGFITSSLDKSCIAATVDGFGFDANHLSYATNIWTGVYLEWPVAASALSETTVKVAGLPNGLKFAAKDVTQKIGSGRTAQTVVVIPANTIYGAPSAASKVDKNGKATPSQVKVTVTTAGKSAQTYQIDTTVDPLPTWAVGTFTGPSYGGEATNGTVAVTIAASGKISAKQPIDGKAVSFASNYFDWYDADDDAFWATLTAKNGMAVLTNEMVVSGHAGRVTLPAVGGGMPTLPGEVAVTNGVIEAERFDAWQYNWKVEPWKTLGKTFDKQTMAYAILNDGTCSAEEEDVAEALGERIMGKVSLKFAASGVITTAGEFVSGFDTKKQKYTTVKATGSATLVPVTNENGLVFVYLKPKGLLIHTRCFEVPLTDGAK